MDFALMGMHHRCSGPTVAGVVKVSSGVLLTAGGLSIGK